ncbi:hypothetical protein CAY62_09895 [Photobacterium damselae subsp. damselae]|nr:hypothetical protein CAY62_09895 [Photobacterium damselae subsp. damselae]
MKCKLLEWALILWIGLVLVMPLIPIHKIIFVFSFIIYGLGVITRDYREIRIITYSPLIITLIFTYGFFLSSVGNYDSDITNQLLSSIAVLYLFYIVYDAKIDLNRIILYCAYLFSFVSIYLFIEGYFLGTTGTLTTLVTKYNIFSLDERNIGFGKILYSRLISVPILFVAFSQLLFEMKYNNKKPYFGLFLFSMVIIFSFTRALIFCYLCIILFYLLHNSSIYKRAVAIILIVLSIISIVMSGTLSLKETSNQTKIEDISNFVNHIEENNSILLIGDGIGSYFYRTGKGLYAKTENTVTDFVRYFGLPLTFIIFISLFFPFKFKWNSKNKFYFVSFFLYSLMSITNPTLFNSFGCIAIIWYWYNMDINKIDNDMVN